MSNSDKKEKVASALFDLTESGALSWEEFSAGAADLPDGAVPLEEGLEEKDSVFLALHEGMDLYLYQREGAEEPRSVLKVADSERGAGWSFPELETVEDLYDLVEFRVSGLEDWMDEVIDEAGERLEMGEASNVSQEGAPDDSASDDSPEEGPGEKPEEKLSEEEPSGEGPSGDPNGEEEDRQEDPAEDPAQDFSPGEEEFAPNEDSESDEDPGIGEPHSEPQEESVFGAGEGESGSGEGQMEEDRII